MDGIRTSDDFITVEAAAQYVHRQAFSIKKSSALAQEVVELRQSNPSSPEATRSYLKLVRLLYIAGSISRDEYIFCFDLKVENVVMDRFMSGEYTELSKLDEQLDGLRKHHRFDESTQDWPGGIEPPNFLDLSSDFGERYEIRYLEALTEFGAIDLAELRGANSAEYYSSRERGRRRFVESEKKLEALEEFVTTCELEAKKCAYSSAYLAAVIMLGSATECRLLIKALKCEAESGRAFRAIEARNGRRASKNPINWSFDILVKVAVEAGWIQGLEIQVPQDKTSGLATLIKTHRNSVHPGRFVRDRVFASVGRHEYEQVEAGYVLLKQALK